MIIFLTKTNNWLWWVATTTTYWTKKKKEPTPRPHPIPLISLHSFNLFHDRWFVQSCEVYLLPPFKKRCPLCSQRHKFSFHLLSFFQINSVFFKKSTHPLAFYKMKHVNISQLFHFKLHYLLSTKKFLKNVPKLENN